MKIRTDFVTNSSSSSFIIARKEELTEKQKEIIVDYVVKYMLGDKIISKKEDIAEYVEEKGYDDDDEYVKDEIESYSKIIDEGKAIYEGMISFESDNELSDLYQNLWNALEEADNDRFTQLDTRLDY